MRPSETGKAWNTPGVGRRWCGTEAGPAPLQRQGEWGCTQGCPPEGLTCARRLRSPGPGKASHSSPGAAVPAGWSGPCRRTGVERQTQPCTEHLLPLHLLWPWLSCRYPGEGGWARGTGPWWGWKGLSSVALTEPQLQLFHGQGRSPAPDWPSAVGMGPGQRAHLGHCREEHLQQGGHRLGTLEHPGTAGHGLQHLVEWRQPGDTGPGLLSACSYPCLVPRDKL